MANDFHTQLMNMTSTANLMGRMHVEIDKAASILSQCIKYGGKIYVIGNGGSAADANHFVGEILGRFLNGQRKALSAVSLTADNATITAIANDFGFEWVFQRQLEGLFDPLTDVLFTMSTSGNSVNILNALQYVHENGGSSVNLLGKGGGETNMFDTGCNIVIPSDSSPRIQEMHKFLLHYFAYVIERDYVNFKGVK